MKACRKCKTAKPLDDYHRSAKAADARWIGARIDAQLRGDR